MSALTDVVSRLIADGADPNDLQDEFEEAVVATGDWGLWGDGHWRREFVCSECGSVYPGLCGHANGPAPTCSLKEWLAKSSQGPET
mgnify:FL=1